MTGLVTVSAVAATGAAAAAAAHETGEKEATHASATTAAGALPPSAGSRTTHVYGTPGHSATTAAALRLQHPGVPRGDPDGGAHGHRRAADDGRDVVGPEELDDEPLVRAVAVDDRRAHALHGPVQLRARAHHELGAAADLVVRPTPHEHAAPPVSSTGS